MSVELAKTPSFRLDGKRALVTGAGRGIGLAAASALADAGAQVTLIAPYNRQLYSGMVPGFVAGHYALDDCVIPLEPLVLRALISAPPPSRNWATSA